MEIVYVDVTGSTTYGMVFRTSDGFVWDAGAVVFEAYSAAGVGDYDVPGLEKGASGIFSMTFPAAITDSGGYKVIIKRRVGAVPAESDLVIWEEMVWWNGTAGTTTPPPSASPDQVTGYVYTYDEAGAIEAGVTLQSYASQIVATTDEEAAIQIGFALDTTTRVVVSGVDGLASFPGLFKGVTYVFWRGTGVAGRTFEVPIPADAADPYPLPSLLGAP